MSNLTSDVRRVFADLVSEDGFELAVPFCHSRFVSMVRHVSEDVCAYLFVQDGRPGGADLTVDLWIAPVYCPDHSIESLVAGYKIQILSSWEIDDSVMKVACNHIKRVLPVCADFVPMIAGKLSDNTYNEVARRFFLKLMNIYSNSYKRLGNFGTIQDSVVRQLFKARSSKAFFLSLDALAAALSEEISEVASEKNEVDRRGLSEGLIELIYTHELLRRSRVRLLALQ